MRNPIWTVSSLAITCAIAALTLAEVYMITRPKIEQHQEETLRTALSQVMPSASHFEELEAGTVWKAINGEGQVLGIVFRVAPQGYGGTIPLVVGIDTTAAITGVGVGSDLKETPGLGLKIREDWFLSQFRGKIASQVALKHDGGTLDGISAATITSRAVCKGIREGIEQYSHYLSAPPSVQSDSSGIEP